MMTNPTGASPNPHEATKTKETYPSRDRGTGLPPEITMGFYLFPPISDDSNVISPKPPVGIGDASQAVL